MGNYALARRCFQDSLAVANETDSVRYFEVKSLNGLGAVAFALGQYRESKRLFADSVRICEEVGVRGVTVTALMGLGKVCRELGELQRSRACFCRALRQEMEARSVDMVPEVLIGLADLLLREGERERAAELLGLIRNDPASSFVVRQRAERLLAEATADLPADIIATATARGEAQTLTDAVASILQNDT
jgi:tetratricopeptide (TPR) repeat protein